jgi:uncharacterized protein
MKQIDIKDIDKLPGNKIAENDTFAFRCHPGLSCFNQCCRNLNLFLYPYDVLRLRSCLEISSDHFLDNYVDVVLRPDSYFPEVLLRMSDTDEQKCPFLTPSGCRVYPDRPDTCRTFPVEHGLMLGGKSGKSQRVSFFRPPKFCEGQYETRQLSLSSWAKDQNAEEYNKMTALWAEMKSLFSSDPWGGEGPSGPRGKMAFMAVYNVDRFRDFVLNSSFSRRYKIKTALLKQLKTDDTRLLKFGFEWVKFYLWGIKGKNIHLRQGMV